MNTSELPGVSGPVWTIVVLAMLLAALAALVYRLYTNRKR
jgi:Mg2+ and Co2+ transporter CorA